MLIFRSLQTSMTHLEIGRTTCRYRIVDRVIVHIPVYSGHPTHRHCHVERRLMPTKFDYSLPSLFRILRQPSSVCIMSIQFSNPSFNGFQGKITRTNRPRRTYTHRHNFPLMCFCKCASLANRRCRRLKRYTAIYYQWEILAPNNVSKKNLQKTTYSSSQMDGTGWAACLGTDGVRSDSTPHDTARMSVRRLSMGFRS